MAVVTTHPTLLASPDGLAVRAAAVVRSAEMSAETEAKLLRAKEQLYVLCQLGGWGAFLVSQFAFSRAFSEKSTEVGRDRVTDSAIIVMVILMGLVLTHYARALITRWGWKQMGWRALVPRVLLMSLGLSFAWSAVSYGYAYMVLGLPWPSKYSPWLFFAASSLNGTGLLLGWFCLYFIYHIFERLSRLQVEQLRLAASVKEAELRALKSQVNPHFLFNSLNSLRALIDEDAPKARESVTRLANMLRYSLQSGQQETVPLEEEIRIVEDYLALELIRHENRLRISWAVSDDARTRSVPPMLLQTLVENAVKYGISTRREGGEVVITASVQAGNLQIGVTNPGEVATPANAAAARAGSSTGVGLRNASERLKLIFGDQAKLTLSTESTGNVTAHVLIPLPPAK